MNKAEERFETIKSNIQDVVKIIDVMGDFGVFGQYEAKAGAVILTSMVRAMTILDPDQTKDFITSYLLSAGKDASLFQETPTADNIGQYL